MGAFGGKAGILFLAPEGPFIRRYSFGNPRSCRRKMSYYELIKTNPYNELGVNANYLLTNIKNEMFKKEYPSLLIKLRNVWILFMMNFKITLMM